VRAREADGHRDHPSRRGSTTRCQAGALLGTEAGRAQDLLIRRAWLRAAAEKVGGGGLGPFCFALAIGTVDSDSDSDGSAGRGCRPVLFRIVFLHENDVFFS
jgi:hypothetical protein